MKQNVAICGLSESKELAKSISRKNKIQYIDVKKTYFKNGEMLTEINDSVRGKVIYVVQSTSSPSSENIMELMIFLDALKRSSARRVNVIIPFYGYSRQDRKAKGRQPITAKLIADMLTMMGVERIITFDLHSSQTQGFFDIPVDDLKAIYLIRDEAKKLKLKNPLILSPDYGGVNRARALSKMMNVPLTILDKRRTKPNESEILNILGPDLEGKDIIIVDDMIDTGGTIVNSLKLLEDKGSTSVNVFCTHGIFSDNAVKKITNFKILNSLYMTNTIEKNIPKYKEISPKLKLIKIDSLLAEVVKAQVENKSLSNLYNRKND